MPKLLEAAERWGTPLYVTDLDHAAARLAAYTAAFPGALIAYAVKANADPQLLRRLFAEGAGAEVVNAVELALARRAGCPPERIVMNGVGKRDEELHLALGAGVLINAESLEELDALLRLAADHPTARVGLRLNPGLDGRTHPHLATGAATSKFGIPLAQLDEARAAVAAAGRELESIGAHIGSDIEDLDAFAQLAEAMARLGAPRIDLGGGLAGADPSALAEAIRQHLPDASRLILEPGRSMVAEAGWLITRVTRVQPRPAEGMTYLVADAGMTELIRPMLYGADHPISLVADGAALPADAGRVDLAGPVCEAGDVLARDIGRWMEPGELANAGTGALLAIGQAGGYGAVMASGYNGRLRPAEVVIDGRELRLSRRRETLDDVLARDA
ncbi:MAG TPA: diaminopimelate decarboxylase [Candidatus Limnocylindria bacterium]|jgi:diaminopimelate decarboxylase